MKTVVNRLAALVALTLLANACAGARAQTRADTPDRDEHALEILYDMPELTLRATPDGYKDWDAQLLFEAGNDAYDEAEWRDAVAHFDRLVRVYPDSELVPAAIFNAGLSALYDGDISRAERYFVGLSGGYPDNELATSALWNLIELREKRDAWREVLETTDRLLRYPLGDNDRFEVEARAWIARAVLKPTDANLERLLETTDDYESRLRRGQVLGRETLARLHWTAGEVYLGRSQAVIVDPDAAALESELEHKAELLLKAQEAYMQTVKSLDPSWATAAVFRIGFAYESFYSDLLSAPAPTSLENVERGVYLEEVREALAPVKRKAELAYERIIRFSKQYGIDTDWVKQAEERLSRLQRLKIPEPEAS